MTDYEKSNLEKRGVIALTDHAVCGKDLPMTIGTHAVIVEINGCEPVSDIQDGLNAAFQRIQGKSAHRTCQADIQSVTLLSTGTYMILYNVTCRM